jgi:outer membrane protein assembly factor BamB
VTAVLKRLVVLIVSSVLPAVAVGEDWPQFRGAQRDDISRETGLLRKWPDGGPTVLWTTEVCQGYAAAAICGGRVYFEDYGRDAKEWYLRCLNLADGRELWRFSESKTIRANHGITRTAPAVDGRYVFALDPKCVFHCLDAPTGKELWRKSFVNDYQAQIPPWNNGQNPLIEPDRVILGVGGEAALMVALDKATGSEIWRTPNPNRWPLSHCSVMPAEIAGVKQYLWCTLFGPIGVRAADGKLLWHHDRKFNVAIAPSPLALPGDRVFMTSGYDAGSVMFRVKKDDSGFSTETIFDWPSTRWNSEVHTPVVFQDHMFAVGKEKRGLLTCLDLDGNIVWTSAGKAEFDLGSYLLADGGLLFILEGKTGMLRLVELNTQEYRELDHAQVLGGDNVWGPMALADGKLVLRDMTKMVCIEVGGSGSVGPPRPKGITARVLRRSQGGDAALSAGHGRPALCAGNAVCQPVSLAAAEPPMRYHKLRVISGKGTARGQFAEALRGLTIDRADRLCAIGDAKLAVFSPEGEFLVGWPTERPGYSVAVAADRTVYVGEEGQIELFDPTGKRLDTWHDADRLGLVTAVALVGDDVLIADTQGRCLRRYDRRGNWKSDIGVDNRMKGFLVPNRYLDFAVDAQGLIHAVNAGMHRVQRYSLDGKLLGHFGRFDSQDPAGFPGCCNPTNIALTPQGQLVVTEKAVPRVKLYSPEGRLLTVVAEGDFDLNCKNMDVSVDSRGRIYVLDTVRLHIIVYEQETAENPATRAAEQPA